MTFWTLIRRSLRFHARAHLGVVLGAAIGSAALIGALVVGDSVRISLRQQALNRVGVAPYFLTSRTRVFSDSTNTWSGAFGQAYTLGLHLEAIVSAEGGGSRANRVDLYGVRPDFWEFAPAASHLSIASDSVLLNRTLAEQLGVKAGEVILVRFQKPSVLAGDAPLTTQTASSLALRLKVQAVLSGAEFGDFTPQAGALPPRNAFMRLEELQRAAGLEGRANWVLEGGVTGQFDKSLSDARSRLWQRIGKLGYTPPQWLSPVMQRELLPEYGPEALDFMLGENWNTTDAGLDFEFLPGRNLVELRSRQVFLEPQVVRHVTGSEGQFGLGPVRLPSGDEQFILTYLANRLVAGSNSTPYSMITAAGPPYVPAGMREDEILVNDWLAQDLRIQPGDTIVLAYFKPESGPDFIEATNRFRVRGVVPLSGIYADPKLMPEFPGLEKAESTRDWDTGFRIDLSRIRPKDEQYWKEHRGTPKAFITLAAGQKLWGNRFGDLTAIRFPVPSGVAPEEFKATLEKSFLLLVRPAEIGLRFEPVRERALKAAEQGQNFGQLFLGFSLFLVVAALLLMALLFQFGLEQRATEIGTLLALGFSPRHVRKLLLTEGVALALAGGVLGALGGIGYAKAMLWGLTTVWRSAVGASDLHFHVTAATLVIGLCASTAVAVLTIGLTLRKQARQPAATLLTGEAGEVQSPKSAIHRPQATVQNRAAWAAMGAGLGAVAIVGWMVAKGDTANAEAFFGAGALLLVAGLAAASGWLAALERGFLNSLEFNRRKRRKRSADLGQNGAAAGLPHSQAGDRIQDQPEIEGSGLPGFVPFVSFCSNESFRLSGLAVQGCARRRKRSLATMALLACGCFVIVAIGVFRLDANQDAARRSSGTGGFALIGQATMPVVQDLNTESGRESFGLGAGDLAGVDFVQFRVREGDEASCLNLNRAQKPRLLGVRPELLAGRFSFAQVVKGGDRMRGWEMLKSESRLNSEGGKTRSGSGSNRKGSPSQSSLSSSRLPAFAVQSDFGLDEVSAIGDADAMEWAMGKKVGDTMDYTDEHGRGFKVRLVGAVAHSILQGSLIIDEAEFVKKFPSASGYQLFLIDAPSNAVPQVSATLSRALQDVGLELTPAVRRLNEFNAVQNTYLGTFQILGGLGLLLGSAGLGVVVLRNVLERRGELGLLLAVGFRRRTLQWLVLSEHGALLGLGLGIGLAAAAVAVLPALLSPAMELPYGSLALTLGAVLLNGAVWTWVATRYALRGDLLEALRNE